MFIHSYSNYYIDLSANTKRFGEEVILTLILSAHVQGHAVYSSLKSFSVRKPQTDIPIPISNFNITGLYGVLMSVLDLSK